MKKSARGLVYSPDNVAQRIKDDAKHTNLDDVTFEYDVIIVGGGTAGCVLASRLSEDPNVRVLLIEAGGSSRNIFFSRIPATYFKLLHTSCDYQLYTEPQANAGNEKIYWPRAKLLGGCTTLNSSIFHYGAPSDYDEWAKTGLEGAEEWSYQAFRTYLLKFENYNPHPDFPKVNLQERGRDGPVDTGYFSYFSNSSKKFMQSCINLGIPENPDVNSPSRGTLGVTKVVTYIDKNRTRISAESAYLTPKVLERSNLIVVLHSTATRIIFSTGDDKKRAIGVEFAHTSGSSVRALYQVKVKKELVLATGAVHSPHLLLLSGVGPRDELEKHNIPIVHDLSGVGRNLQDHLSCHGTFSLTSGNSLQYLQGYNIVAKVRSLVSFAQYMLFGSGPMSTNGSEAPAFIRSDDSKLFDPDKYSIDDETSGPNAPDIEVLMLPIGFKGVGEQPIPLPSMNIVTILLRPQSRGQIRLKSASPFDAPFIDPRYLESRNDLAVLVRGVRLILKLVKTEPISSISKKHDYALYDYDLEKLSDDALEQEVRKRVQSLCHPTSTCRMAKLEDGGVVDARLKVHGLENVRVVDASVFPRIVSGHPVAAVYGVAEKAADMIKQAL